MQKWKIDNIHWKIYKLCQNLLFTIGEQFKLDETLFEVKKSHGVGISHTTYKLFNLWI